MTFYLHESFHLFKAKIIYLLFFTEEFNESSKNLIFFKTIVMTCFLSQLVLWNENTSYLPEITIKPLWQHRKSQNKNLHPDSGSTKPKLHKTDVGDYFHWNISNKKFQNIFFKCLELGQFRNFCDVFPYRCWSGWRLPFNCNTGRGRIWFTETDSLHLLESTHTHNPGSDIDIFYQDIYELLHCWIMIGGYEPKLCSIDIKATVFCAINSPAKAPFKSFKNFMDSTKPCSSQRWGKFSWNFLFDFFLLSVLTPVGADSRTPRGD